MVLSPSNAESLTLMLGGLLGAFLRSYITPTHVTWSRKTLGDLIIGGLVGVLWPLYPLIDFPASATLMQKAAIVAALAYVGGDLIQNALAKFGKRTLPVLLISLTLFAGSGLSTVFAGASLTRSSDNVIDCKKIDCNRLQFSSVSLAPDAYLTLHLVGPLPTDRISLAADDSWVRLHRIIRALIERDPAFADVLLKREHATYRYQDGRMLGMSAGAIKAPPIPP